MNQANAILSMTQKEKELFDELNTYFKENPYIELIQKINNSEVDITLRFLDMYIQGNPDYEMMLKKYTKTYFDPFRRKIRFNYEYSDNEVIDTSLAQLNFFKFMIESKSLETIA